MVLAMPTGKGLVAAGTADSAMLPLMFASRGKKIENSTNNKYEKNRIHSLWSGFVNDQMASALLVPSI